MKAFAPIFFAFASFIAVSIPTTARAGLNPQLETSLRTYFANTSNETALKSTIAYLKSTISSNSGNAACAVYAFGTLQAVESMPYFVSASNKNIQILKSTKDESVAKTGTANASKWDDLITSAQVEFQKNLAYRGDVIGSYITAMKAYCK